MERYTTSTPYYLTNIVNNQYLDILKYRPIPKNPDDVYSVITMAYEYRPDKFAYDLYNDAQLWWVFAARNPNRLGEDPYFSFKAGLGIYIPRVDTLRTYLGI